MTACYWPGCETVNHPGRPHPEPRTFPCCPHRPSTAPFGHKEAGPRLPEPPTLTVCRVMQVDEDIYGGERSFTVHVEWPPMAAHMLPEVGSEVTVGPSPDAFFAWMRGSQAGKERIIAAAIALADRARDVGHANVAMSGELGVELYAAVRDFMGGK